MEHTELPWGVGWNNGLSGPRTAFTAWIREEKASKYEVIHHGKDLIGIIPHGFGDAKQDTAFIIRACKNHDKLLEALKAAREAITTLPIDILGEGRDGELVWPLRDELLDNINKAIKEAEE